MREDVEVGVEHLVGDGDVRERPKHPPRYHLGVNGSSRFESLILSHHSRFNVACECNKEEINDDDDGTGGGASGDGGLARREGVGARV